MNIVKRTLSEIYIVVLDQSMQMEPDNEPVDDLRRLMKVLVEEKMTWVKAEKVLEEGEYDKFSGDFNKDKDNMAKWYKE